MTLKATSNHSVCCHHLFHVCLPLGLGSSWVGMCLRVPTMSLSAPVPCTGLGGQAQGGADAGGSPPGLLSLLYLPTGFFALARGGCPSLSTELLLLLQPLSVLTFHLDLLFEHHHQLPPGPPPAPAPPGAPPALQQTVQAMLHWGGRLAQSLRGASGATPPGPSPPSSSPTPGGWWEQLTQASRVYASGGSEGFSLPRWGSRRPGTAAEGAQERAQPAEDVAPGRGVWLGRLFGAPGGPTESAGGALKSR